jgi:hypothetical protein
MLFLSITMIVILLKNNQYDKKIAGSILALIVLFAVAFFCIHTIDNNGEGSGNLAWDFPSMLTPVGYSDEEQTTLLTFVGCLQLSYGERSDAVGGASAISNQTHSDY